MSKVLSVKEFENTKKGFQKNNKKNPKEIET